MPASPEVKGPARIASGCMRNTGPSSITRRYGRHVGRIALATVTAFAAVQAVPAGSSHQHVSSFVALQPVVAWPPNEPVPAGASGKAVVAAPAADRIVASETGNHVTAGCTDDGVVPGRAQTHSIRHTVDRAAAARRRTRWGDRWRRRWWWLSYYLKLEGADVAVEPLGTADLAKAGYAIKPLTRPVSLFLSCEPSGTADLPFSCR